MAILRFTDIIKSLSQLDQIEKAAKGDRKSGAKYKYRLPHPSPPPNWLYVYDEVARRGKYIHHEDNFVVGAAFEAKHDGKVGHWEIVDKKKDGTLIVRHDNEPPIEMSPADLSAKLKKEHAFKIGQHRERTKRVLRKMTLKGGLAGKLYADYAAQYGIYTGPDFDLSPGPQDEGEVTADAITLHADALPAVESVVPQHIANFPVPDEVRGIYSLKKHQQEGVARSMDSLKKRDGFVLQDDAGLGKTLTGLAAMVAQGGKRNLIVVPNTGKHNLIDNGWKGDAKLYGLELEKVTGKKNPPAKGDGTWICSYQDLYELQPILDPATGKTIGKRPVLRPGYENFDTVLFDESHSMKNAGTYTGQAGVLIQEKAKKCIYMSATPTTTLQDMHYMRKLGQTDGQPNGRWFHDGDSFAVFCDRAGARVNYDKGGRGDIPARIKDPRSVVPLTTIAAMMHFEGSGLKRQTILNKINVDFTEVPASTVRPEIVEALNAAQEIADIAVDIDGCRAFTAAGILVGWKKSMWELAKVDKAVDIAREQIAGRKFESDAEWHEWMKKAMDPNDPTKPLRQVGVFSNYKESSHTGLLAFARMIRDKVAQGTLDPKKGEEAAKKIEEKVAKLVKGSAIDRFNERMAGPFGDKIISQVHGKVPNKQSIEDHQRFQNGDTFIANCTIPKAGTGLNFHHDRESTLPRTQINIGMSWTGVGFQQLSGRMNRLGMKSKTNMVWLVGDAPEEKQVAAAVDAKQRSMGALVAGDPKYKSDSRMRAIYDTSTEVNPNDLIETLVKGEKDGEFVEPGTKSALLTEGQRTLLTELQDGAIDPKTHKGDTFQHLDNEAMGHALKDFETQGLVENIGTTDKPVYQLTAAGHEFSFDHTEDEEAVEAVNNYRKALTALKEGGDPLGEIGVKLKEKQAQAKDRRHRRAASQLIAAGLDLRSDGLHVRIGGAGKGMPLHEEFKKYTRTWNLRDGQRPKYDKKTGEFVMPEGVHFQRLAKRLGHGLKKVPPIKNWSQDAIDAARNLHATERQQAIDRGVKRLAAIKAILPTLDKKKNKATINKLKNERKKLKERVKRDQETQLRLHPDGFQEVTRKEYVKTQKSMRFADIIKSLKPPAGFRPMPRSKHGGYISADGKRTWYPDGSHKHAHKTKAVAGHHIGKMDASRGIHSVRPDDHEEWAAGYHDGQIQHHTEKLEERKAALEEIKAHYSHEMSSGSFGDFSDSDHSQMNDEIRDAEDAVKEAEAALKSVKKKSKKKGKR